MTGGVSVDALGETVLLKVEANNYSFKELGKEET